MLEKLSYFRPNMFKYVVLLIDRYYFVILPRFKSSLLLLPSFQINEDEHKIITWSGLFSINSNEISGPGINSMS